MSEWNTNFAEDRAQMRLLGLPVPLPFALDPGIAATQEAEAQDHPHVTALRASLIDQARRVIMALAADPANNLGISRQFGGDEDFRICRLSGGLGVRIDLVAFGAFCRTRRETDRLTELHCLIATGRLN